jgi:hypothetical protein
MKRTIILNVLFVLALGLLVVACQQQPTAPEETPSTTPPPTEPPAPPPATYPDPGPEVVGEVEAFIRAWVAEQVGENEEMKLPPRGGHDVTGKLEAFHTVHQKDEDTYSVCVDFVHGDETYDVDFFVDQTDEGMTVADHFLHKVNGEPVEAGT